MPAERAAFSPSATFPLKALGWSLGLFALLRSPWVVGHLVAPLTRWQETAAVFYFGEATASIEVTPDCSGADVLALCLAAILSWPSSWRSRITGSALGISLILILNTLRIGTLGRAASSRDLFETLHLQVWPAILVLATAGYVCAWMSLVVRTRVRGPGLTKGDLFGRRFGALAALFLIAFAFFGSRIDNSENLRAASAWTAGVAASVLAEVGVAASASANILTTSRGAFAVTPECLATALIPLYLAGVFAATISWGARALALALALPFFASLAVARLLLLALPSALIATPLFLVHGFHQLVLSGVVVAALSLRHTDGVRDRRKRATMRAALALGTASIFAAAAGHALTQTLLAVARTVVPMTPHSLVELARPDDVQGALATLFVFQAGFLLALGVAVAASWRRLSAAFALLFATQALFLMMLVELVDRFGWAPHPLLLRAFAVGLPIFMTLAIQGFRRPAEHPNLQLAPHGSP